MTEPSSPTAFNHVQQVRFADTDAQGHVFFGNYYTYMDEAYLAYQDALGFSWAALRAMGLEIHYVASECQFLAPAFFGDRLCVSAVAIKLGNSSLAVKMTITRKTRAGEVIVAEGSITGVFVDRESGRSTPMPEAFRQAVRHYRRGSFTDE